MAIWAQGLGFRHAGRALPAFEDVSFRIEDGEKVLLLGPSGCGKSTLLGLIAGVSLEGDTTGTVQVDGRVGMVLQDPDSQVIAARLGDDIAFGCENLRVPRPEIWRRVEQAKEAVGLGALPVDHPTHRLSGGQKQRMALAGVLAMQPDVVVLDEPTANIDPEGVAQIRQAVATTCQDKTLIIVEHSVSTWVDVVDRVIILDGGVVFDGPLDTMPAYPGVWMPGVEPDLDPGWVDTARECTPLLEAENLSVGWKRSAPLMEGLTLALDARATVITGPNGRGKSTLGLTLAGLLEPLAGRLHPNTTRMRSRELARQVGMVFQEPEYQFVARTVREELGDDGLMERLGLDRLAKANPFTLSGGQKRRLSVGTAIAAKPRLVVLDEPTFGQDMLTFTTTVELLRELADSGVGVVAITHDPLVVKFLGQRRISL